MLGLKEPAARVGIGAEMRAEKLERDRVVEVDVLGLVDDTHTTLADFGTNLIIARRYGQPRAAYGTIATCIAPTVRRCSKYWTGSP